MGLTTDHPHVRVSHAPQPQHVLKGIHDIHMSPDTRFLGSLSWLISSEEIKPHQDTTNPRTQCPMVSPQVL